MKSILVLLGVMIAGCETECGLHIEAELSCADWPLEGVDGVTSWASLLDDCSEHADDIGPIATCATSSSTCQDYLDCVHLYLRDKDVSASSARSSASR